MKLSQYQKKALGIKKEQEMKGYIWNEKIAKVYDAIDETNLNLGDQGQTFLDFKKMEKRPPNQYGTGRYKFSYIDKIELIFIPKKGLCEPSQEIKDIICKFIQTYLRIPSLPQKTIKLEINGNILFDKTTKTVFDISYFEEMVDAHDILSVLLEKHQQKTILLAFIEEALHEQEVAIDGRAYGDGVAVVYYSRKDLEKDLQTYLQTLVHETFHTLGFDHCLAWKCLMNGYTNFESWLCPACSKKLYHELRLNSSLEVVQWIRELIQYYGQIKAKKAVRKGNQLIKAIESLIVE